MRATAFLSSSCSGACGVGAGLGPSLIRRVGENKGECLGRAEAWVLRAASLPHSIAQNAIEWGTPMVWATRQ